MNYSCSTPVLLIFFNRPDTFAKVFEKVREAKPKTLILAQDGPRNENDVAGINECRKIAESVDWECEVIRQYSDVNLGCGVRPQSAISFALEKYESVIILEDDCVPSPSFFPYCEELLEKYKDDERIGYISGLNHFETWDCGDQDYFFAKAGSIGAWATWRRAWKPHYDYYAENINDPYVVKLYQQQVGDKYIANSRIQSLKKANNSLNNGEKLSYWDTQWGFAHYTQGLMVIVPKKNLICNIGVGASSTHATKLTTTKYVKYKNIVFIPTYLLEFPLKHPKACVADLEYHTLIYKCSRPSWIKRAAAKILRHNKH
ncbi:MAG: hypothetical protein IJX02_01075 [Clostridia bacterium]|nr:hypothetical protein [Clostridia bacterium]